jgi:hypothetical protein
MAVLAMPETLALALPADMQTMDLQLFRITVMPIGPHTATCPRMAMPGAINAVTGMVPITMIIVGAINTMIIVVVTTENPGAKNRADSDHPFLLEYCMARKIFTTKFFWAWY